MTGIKPTLRSTKRMDTQDPSCPVTILKALSGEVSEMSVALAKAHFGEVRTILVHVMWAKEKAST